MRHGSRLRIQYVLLGFKLSLLQSLIHKRPVDICTIANQIIHKASTKFLYVCSIRIQFRNVICNSVCISLCAIQLIRRSFQDQRFRREEFNFNLIVIDSLSEFIRSHNITDFKNHGLKRRKKFSLFITDHIGNLSRLHRQGRCKIQITICSVQYSRIKTKCGYNRVQQITKEIVIHVHILSFNIVSLDKGLRFAICRNDNIWRRIQRVKELFKRTVQSTKVRLWRSQRLHRIFKIATYVHRGSQINGMNLSTFTTENLSLEVIQHQHRIQFRIEYRISEHRISSTGKIIDLFSIIKCKFLVTAIEFRIDNKIMEQINIFYTTNIDIRIKGIDDFGSKSFTDGLFCFYISRVNIHRLRFQQTIFQRLCKVNQITGVTSLINIIQIKVANDFTTELESEYSCRIQSFNSTSAKFLSLDRCNNISEFILINWLIAIREAIILVQCSCASNRIYNIIQIMRI